MSDSPTTRSEEATAGSLQFSSGDSKPAVFVPEWFRHEVNQDHSNECRLLVKQVVIIAMLAGFVVLRSLLLT